MRLSRQERATYLARVGYGDMIRKARVERSWTQGELAVAADLSRSAIERVEAGNAAVSAAQYEKLLVVLPLLPPPPTFKPNSYAGDERFAVSRSVEQGQRLGQAVRAWRMEHRLSQYQIADMAGVSQTQISRLERGEAIEDMKTLRAVVRLDSSLQSHDLEAIVARRGFAPAAPAPVAAPAKRAAPAPARVVAPPPPPSPPLEGMVPMALVGLLLAAKRSSGAEVFDAVLAHAETNGASLADVRACLGAL